MAGFGGLERAVALDFFGPEKRAFSFYAKHGWVVTESKTDIVYLRKNLACPRPAPNPR